MAAAHPTPGFTLKASSGQFTTHAPHSMHRSGSRIATARFKDSKTGCGQTLIHIMQPLHNDRSSPIVVTPLT
jgi:hypothetical protein